MDADPIIRSVDALDDGRLLVAFDGEDGAPVTLLTEAAFLTHPKAGDTALWSPGCRTLVWIPRGRRRERILRLSSLPAPTHGTVRVHMLFGTVLKAEPCVDRVRLAFLLDGRDSPVLLVLEACSKARCVSPGDRLFCEDGGPLMWQPMDRQHRALGAPIPLSCREIDESDKLASQALLG